MRKRILAVLLAAVLVFPAVPDTRISAAEVTQNSNEVTQDSNEEMQKTMTSILTKVKKRISVPEKLSEFTYDYDQVTKDTVRWTFYWSDTDYTKSLRVVCDQAANITSYSENDYESKRTGAIKYLRSELYEKALAYIKQLNPGMEKHVRLTDVYYSYSNEYTYSFIRMENELPMQDNTVSVSLSAEDGSLEGMRASWNFDLKVPDGKPKITKENAAKLIGKNLSMKLSYRSFTTTDDAGNMITKAYLVYEPDNSYLAVDAMSGEVYTTKSEWNVSYTKNQDMNDSAESAMATGAKDNGLTQKEIAKIDELKDLISKEKAIALIKNNKSLLLENTAKSVTATLYQEYQLGEEKTNEYYWHVEFSDPREPDYDNNDYYRAYAQADINAKTGEIISYRASVKGQYGDPYENDINTKLNYNDDKLRSVFTTFAKKQNAARFAMTKLNQEENDYVFAKTDDKEVYGGKSYTYTRYHQDIPFDENYIYGSVDKVTGKIYSYGSWWTEDITFESSKGAMTSEEALKAFLANDAFDLSYEINTVNNYDMSKDSIGLLYEFDSAYNISYQARLVYSIENICPMMISPFTGKQIAWDGSEYNVKELNLLSGFSDIGNSPYKRSIQILNDIGLNLDGDKFYPETYISCTDLVAFTEAAGFRPDDMMKEFIGDGKVTRQKAAAYFTHVIGLDEIAALDGIYKTDYSDESSIDKANVGGVALMKGFGIMTDSVDGNFNPDEYITRAQAADMLLKLLGIQNSMDRYYY